MESRRRKGRGKNFLTTAVKGMAQLKVDRLMEQHARDPNSSMEDVINALIADTLKVEDLPLEDRFGSLAMSTYLVGMLQGLAIVRESGLVSEDVMIKIVTGISPDFEAEEEEDKGKPYSPKEVDEIESFKEPPAVLPEEYNKIFRSKPDSSQAGEERPYG